MFQGPQSNAREARPRWLLQAKGKTLAPSANRMREVTGHVGDKLALYDSSRNKPGLLIILSTEKQLPKLHFKVWLPP